LVLAKGAFTVVAGLVHVGKSAWGNIGEHTTSA